MASGTIYFPQTLALDASKVMGAGQGVSATCSANTTTNIDLALSDDMIITGLELITSGASVGDYVVLQAVVGGFVAATPVPGPWYVSENGDSIFDFIIPTKIVAGVTLRVVYHATALLITPTVSVNYKLWKVLV